MTESQFASLLASAALFPTFLMQRRAIFSASAIGVFLTTNFVVNIIGVLAVPWVLPQLEQWFYFIDWSLLAEGDYVKGIVITVGGTFIAVIAYYLAQACTEVKIRNPPNLLSPHRQPRLGFNKRLVILSSIISIILTLFYASSKMDVFLTGIQMGFMPGEAERVYLAREATTSNYFYVLSVYNVLPFFAVLLWLWARLKGSLMLKLYASTYAAITSGLLVLVFQKLMFVVFLTTLVLAEIWVHRCNRSERSDRRTKGRSRSSSVWGQWIRVAFLGVVILISLSIVYFLHTGLGRGESAFELAISLLRQVVIEVLGRTSVATPLFAHYFPNIAPHYGLGNIGVIAVLMNREVYGSTVAPFRYFSGFESGSMAINVHGDFYGAFGWIGWAWGMTLIGVILFGLDKKLEKMKPSVSKTSLVLFMFVFILYLSTASLPNAVLGYGGGIFYGLWVGIRFSLSRKSMLVQRTRSLLEPGG
jgi:hypothetical protein